MTIGEALKKEQEELGLTAMEMAAGVITKGTYSKVVNNKARLSTDLLLKILFFHSIDIKKFFDMTRETYAPKNLVLDENLSKKFGLAFNNHDVDAAKKYLEKIKKSSSNPYLIQRAQIGVAFLSNDFKQLDNKFSDLILKELSSHENWITDIQALKLFSNSMLVLSEENVENQMKIFFTRIKRMNLQSESMIERYAIVCSNYLHWKYDRCDKLFILKNVKISKNVNCAIDFLKKLDKTPHLMIYQILGNYYECLFFNSSDKALEVKKHLQELGFEKLTQNWPV